MATVTTLKQHIQRALTLGIEYEEGEAVKAATAQDKERATVRATRARVLRSAQRRVAASKIGAV